MKRVRKLLKHHLKGQLRKETPREYLSPIDLQPIHETSLLDLAINELKYFWYRKKNWKI